VRVEEVGSAGLCLYMRQVARRGCACGGLISAWGALCVLQRKLCTNYLRTHSCLLLGFCK
jgi:hypothetical protein